MRVFTADDVYGITEVFRQAAEVVRELGADGVGVTTKQVAEVIGLGVESAHQRLYQSAENNLIYRAGVRSRLNLWLPVGVELQGDNQSTWGRIREILTRLDDGAGVSGFAIADEIGVTRSNVGETLKRYQARGYLKQKGTRRSWRWSLTAKGRKANVSD